MMTAKIPCLDHMNHRSSFIRRKVLAEVDGWEETHERLITIGFGHRMDGHNVCRAFHAIDVSTST